MSCWITNLHEVRARPANYMCSPTAGGNESEDGITVIKCRRMPRAAVARRIRDSDAVAAYHVAVLKGTDVDQPRNLAASPSSSAPTSVAPDAVFDPIYGSEDTSARNSTLNYLRHGGLSESWLFDAHQVAPGSSRSASPQSLSVLPQGRLQRHFYACPSKCEITVIFRARVAGAAVVRYEDPHGGCRLRPFVCR